MGHSWPGLDVWCFGVSTEARVWVSGTQPLVIGTLPALYPSDSLLLYRIVEFNGGSNCILKLIICYDWKASVAGPHHCRSSGASPTTVGYYSSLACR
jgi:hypothetical protein